MWYMSALSNSECHIPVFFIFNFTYVLALVRYSPTVSLLVIENFDIFTLLVPILVDQ